MTHPPSPPGPPSPGTGGTGSPSPPSHEATQAFPVGGAPPPPPPDPSAPAASPAPVAPGPAPAPPPSHDATRSLPRPAAPGDAEPAPHAGGYGGAGYGAAGYGGAAYGGAAYDAAPPVPPTGAAPAPASSGRSTGRILGRAVVVLVVVAALVGVAAWGLANRHSAEQWRERSLAADEDLTRSLERVETTEAELEEARVRLRELANEKAGEADENRILSQIVAQAPQVTAALADCQAQTATLANELIDALGTAEPDLSGLQARTDEVNEICNAALEQAEALEATIDGLG